MRSATRWLSALSVAAAVTGLVVASHDLHTATAAAPQRAIGAAVTQPFLFGISESTNFKSMTNYQTFATATGERPQIASFYASFDEPWPKQKLDAIAAAGATAMITWEPTKNPRGVTCHASVTDCIASGAWESAIKSWAIGAAKDGRRTLIRFGHEFNASWYPWNVSKGATAASFVRAWQHVHDLFVWFGAGKVEWVWSMQPPDNGVPQPDAWWPGSSNVNWIAVDAYNAGTTKSWGGWMELSELTESSLAAARRIDAYKRIMISETASSAHGGDRATWIRNASDMLETNPQIRSLVWFDLNKTADWKVDGDPASLKALGDLARRATS